jgi:diguanylate cyclase (GGDEF)-like protein
MEGSRRKDSLGAADKPDQPQADPVTGPLRAEIERLQAELMQAKWTIAELEARADIDPLLDILNRRGFDRELSRAVAYVGRYGTQAALVFIDLDGFKAVNDRHGHAAGDELLKTVARQLTGRVRASDVVARFGGDEFAVLLWNLDEAQANAKARELEEAIASVLVDDGRFGASAGVVPLAGKATPAEIVDAADKAMYARKRERRG